MDAADDNPYAAFAGDWVTEVYGPDGGEPLVVSMIKATDNDEGWSMKFNHLEDAIPATNVFMKDDSVVFQIGSYPSALREGENVASVTSYLHAHGDAMSGRFVAEYENGDVLRGKLSSTKAP